MAVYFLNVGRKKRNTAGAKAPSDIDQICLKNGFRPLNMSFFPKDRSKAFQKAWLLTAGSFAWIKVLWKVNKNDVIVYQHPMYGARITARMIPLIKKKKKVQFIALIHDLETLRGGIEGVLEGSDKTYEINDGMVLSQFDHIICHNSNMKKALTERGLRSDRIVTLGIFDYLTDVEPKKRTKGERPSIAIAGNLAFGKSQYLYKIKDESLKKNKSLDIHLYGINYEPEREACGMKYHGSFSPEELPGKLEGDFGLVWDGSSADTCAGNTGNYLRYNDPHKTSLYLVAGMPVVTWSEAAVAEFILKNHVGFAVDSLDELEERIQSISDEEYLEMCHNAREISAKLRKGGFFTGAVRSCGVNF